jgi:hypothetical protein
MTTYPSKLTPVRVLTAHHQASMTGWTTRVEFYVELEVIQERMRMMELIGLGFDVHALDEDGTTKIIIGYSCYKAAGMAESAATILILPASAGIRFT